MGATSPNRARFIEEYLVDLNGSAAAIRAGYSESRARITASELLAKPHIQEAIAAAKAERSERTQITQDRVLKELARIAFGDLRAMFTEDGALKGPAELDDDTAAAIASIEVVVRPSGERDEDGNVIIEHVHKIKAWDKNTALTNLARHLKLLTEKVEHSGPDGGPIRTEGTTTLDVSALTDEQLAALASIRVQPG